MYLTATFALAGPVRELVAQRLVLRPTVLRADEVEVSITRGDHRLELVMVMLFCRDDYDDVLRSQHE